MNYFFFIGNLGKIGQKRKDTILKGQNHRVIHIRITSSLGNGRDKKLYVNDFGDDLLIEGYFKL